VRPVAAAHGGFGFGANAIKKKSIETAIADSAIKESRLNQLLQQPVHSDGTIANLAAVRPSLAPIVAPVANFTPFTPTLSYRQPMVIATPKQTVRNRNTQVSHQVQQQEAQEVKHNSEIANKKYPAIGNVEIGRAFLAWILDTIVAASAFVIAMGSNYASVNPDSASPIISILSRLSSSENLFFTVMVLNVTITSLALLFAAQFAMLLFTGATAGRFAMSMKIRADSIGQRVVRGICAAISETATLGGILSLPFIIAMPSRVSLAPWVQYRVRN
jgi:hypothetical protein